MVCRLVGRVKWACGGWRRLYRVHLVVEFVIIVCFSKMNKNLEEGCVFTYCCEVIFMLVVKVVVTSC